MLEGQLLKIRPYLDLPQGRYFFHLQKTSTATWNAFYGNMTGQVLYRYSVEADTPIEAVAKLQKTLDLLALLEKPSIKEGN